MECIVNIRHERTPQSTVRVKISGEPEATTLTWNESPAEQAKFCLAEQGGVVVITPTGLWEFYGKLGVTGKRSPVLTLLMPPQTRLEDMSNEGHGAATVLRENAFFKGTKKGLTWRIE